MSTELIAKKNEADSGLISLDTGEVVQIVVSDPLGLGETVSFKCKAGASEDYVDVDSQVVLKAGKGAILLQGPGDFQVTKSVTASEIGVYAVTAPAA